MAKMGSGIAQVAWKLALYGGRLVDRADGFGVPGDRLSAIPHKAAGNYGKLTFSRRLRKEI
jgi:hypothetical protein